MVKEIINFKMDNAINRKIWFNQILLLLILLFTILSGAVRKWGTNIGSINLLITFIQILIIYTFIFIKGKSILSNKSISGVFVVYVIYLGIAAFNPLSPSIYHAVSGFIVHLSFWLGLFIYITNKDVIKTDRFSYIVLVFVLLESVLAIIQYQLPRENAINQYAMVDEFDEIAALSVAMVGDAVRVTGTFTYISGFSAFVLFTQFFSFSLFYKKNIKKYIPIIGLALSLVLAFQSGSRSTTILNLILTVAFFTFQLRDYKYTKLFGTAAGLILFITMNISLGDPLGIVDSVTTSYENFDSRFEQNKEEGQGRAYTPLLTIFDNEFPSKLIGNGLGITYPAVVAAKGTSKVAETFAVRDDEIGRTLLEGGYLLLILKLMLIFIAIKNLDIDKRFMTIVFTIVFLYVPLSTNIYNIVFFLMGIVYLEQAILKNKNSTSEPIL